MHFVPVNSRPQQFNSKFDGLIFLGKKNAFFTRNNFLLNWKRALCLERDFLRKASNFLQSSLQDPDPSKLTSLILRSPSI